MYGATVGGCITAFSLQPGMSAAWGASTEISTIYGVPHNMPLFRLLDDLAGYYVFWGLTLLGLTIIVCGWLFFVARRTMR